MQDEQKDKAGLDQIHYPSSFPSNIDFMEHIAHHFLDKYGLPPYMDDITMEEEQIRKWMVMFSYVVIPLFCHPDNKKVGSLDRNFNNNPYDVQKFMEFYRERLQAEEGIHLQDMILEELKDALDESWNEKNWNGVHLYMNEIRERTGGE